MGREINMGTVGHADLGITTVAVGPATESDVQEAEQEDMRPKVLIVGGGLNYVTMWDKLGFTVTKTIEDAQIICFTGGEDVHPDMYGHAMNGHSHCNLARDKREAAIFETAVDMGLPCVGICRGAQFLHVMNGGTLYQHVDNHTTPHSVISVIYGKMYGTVTSTHHQMMRHNCGTLMAYSNNRTTTKQYTPDGMQLEFTKELDCESIWHERTSTLCFQPHPEHQGAESTFQLFCDLLKHTYGSYFPHMMFIGGDNVPN